MRAGNRSMRQIIRLSMRFFLLSALILAMSLTGCSGLSFNTADGSDVNVTIRISMYNDIAYSGWRTYVEEQCPEINFIWENNRNSTQNLIYQASHGDMADIVTIRRFENDSATGLAPYLMDLGNEPLTDTFSKGTLDSFTFDGHVCWYPAPGMMESILANISLFNKYGITVPKTVHELEEACLKFREAGIDGLMTDAGTGYRSTFLLEGFSYADYFAKNEGKEWLNSFLAGNTPELPSAGGDCLYSLLKDFEQNDVLSETDLSVSGADVQAGFAAGKAAMTMIGSDQKYQGKTDTEYSIIPCLGTSETDRILYTYPVFSTAVSKAAENDAPKKAAVEKVLSAMYSSEAQQILANGSDALISYNEGIDLPVSDTYGAVADLIREKKYFIRFLNRNMFSAAPDALADVIAKDTSEDVFLQDFNTALNKPLDTAVVGTSDVKAGNQLGEDYLLERSAASVLAQTVQEALGADTVILEGKSAAAPIYKGNYTSSDVNAAVVDEKLFQAELTGAQLQEIFDKAILATTTYAYSALEPLVDYPAISGAKAFLSTDGGTNRLLAPDGKEIDKNAVYHVVLSQTILTALTYLQDENASAFTPCEDTLQGVFKTRLASGSLPKPEQYYEVGTAE